MKNEITIEGKNADQKYEVRVNGGKVFEHFSHYICINQAVMIQKSFKLIGKDSEILAKWSN